jgi:hypothetical protein
MMKTSELQGAALDWAVAKCVGWKRELCYLNTEYPNYSENWSLAGPIIEREGVSMRFSLRDARGAWYSVMGKNLFLSPDFEGSGPTPLIAAMRCYVASKLGEEVEIPEELVGVHGGNAWAK